MKLELDSPMEYLEITDHQGALYTIHHVSGYRIDIFDDHIRVAAPGTSKHEDGTDVYRFPQPVS
jgi:hypothetical protein